MLYASKRRSYRPPHPPGPQPVAVVRQIIARRARLFSLDVDGIGMGERAKLSGQRGGSEHDAGRVGGALGENYWFGLEAQKKIKNAAGPFRRCGASYLLVM